MRVLIALALLRTSAARATTHEINTAPVRGFLNNKVLGKTKLELTSRLNEQKPSAGISAQAVTKAHQTLVGLEGFNSGNKGANYVRKMGDQKLLISAVEAHDYANYDTMIQRFVVRSDKAGLVMARGYVKNGAITWTRSHNEHSPSTPAETNGAK